MTMIDSTPAPIVHSETDLLRIELENSKNIISNLRNTLDEQRQSVRRLYGKINQHIEDNELDIEDDIPLASLDEYLSDSFLNTLIFTKMYEVQITFTVDATIQLEAKSEEEARSMAEEIGVYNIDLDTEGDVNEWALDYSTVNYVGRDTN